MSFAPPEYEDSSLNGVDFSWLAVDKDGHVAWLVTFGSAVVPKWVEESAQTLDVDEKALMTLPERGSCSATDSSHYVEGWRATARRGIFAYDWDVYSGPYLAIATPDDPLKLEDLPPTLAAIAQRTRFTRVCFKDSPALQVADVKSCVQGDTA